MRRQIRRRRVPRALRVNPPVNLVNLTKLLAYLSLQGYDWERQGGSSGESDVLLGWPG